MKCGGGMQIKDLKIGKKLGICFVILLVLTTASNGYTLYN